MLPYGSINKMFEAIAASKNLSKEDAHALGIFLRDLTAMDPLDAQAQYSELFDRGRATSLLLFEHVHGESVTAARRWWTCWRSTSSTACS